MLNFCQFGAGRIGQIHAGNIAAHPGAMTAGARGAALVTSRSGSPSPLKSAALTPAVLAATW